MHYVYVLGMEKRKKWYIGCTSDLKKRLLQHKRLHPGYRLVYYEAYESRDKAVERERKLKYYGSAWRTLRDRIRA